MEYFSRHLWDSNQVFLIAGLFLSLLSLPSTSQHLNKCEKKKKTFWILSGYHRKIPRDPWIKASTTSKFPPHSCECSSSPGKRSLFSPENAGQVLHIVIWNNVALEAPSCNRGFDLIYFSVATVLIKWVIKAETRL